MCNRIDKLGRLVIPINLRKKYNLCEGEAVEFREKDGCLVIQNPAPICRICRQNACEDEVFPLCKDCIDKVKNRQS